MGLGGNLIWTGVLKAIYEYDGLAPIVCKTPCFSDLLRGVYWDREVSYRDDPVFHLNPNLSFTDAETKSYFEKAIDRIGSLFLRLPTLRRFYEIWVQRCSESTVKKGGARIVHVDMLIHSYAQKQASNRMLWKSGGHATQVIGRGFGLDFVKPDCEMIFSSDEELWLAEFIKQYGLTGRFVVIEPGTNEEWFGSLRSWSMERWVELTQQFKTNFPRVPLVQIGMEETRSVNATIDLRGKTTFRQAALLMRHSSLFVGTEGGLMHAAKATGANALILWGGVTLPEFAGYPGTQRVICYYVPCAPCGNLGWCDNDHICMKSIEVPQVLSEIKQILQRKVY